MLDYSDELKDNYDLMQKCLKAFDDKNFEDLEEIVTKKLSKNISSYMRTHFLDTTCTFTKH